MPIAKGVRVISGGALAGGRHKKEVEEVEEGARAIAGRACAGKALGSRAIGGSKKQSAYRTFV